MVAGLLGEQSTTRSYFSEFAKSAEFGTKQVPDEQVSKSYSSAKTEHALAYSENMGPTSNTRLGLIC